jgi:hypothetical protein
MGNANDIRLEAQRRRVAIAAVASLVIAAIASAWGFLAAQSPSSPLHVGPLVGPIESLARACWIAGAIGLALSAALPSLALRPADERRAVILLALGWLVVALALLAGALLGTSGTQVIAAYPKTAAVILVKLAGFAVLLAGLVWLLVGVVRRGR